MVKLLFFWLGSARSLVSTLGALAALLVPSVRPGRDLFTLFPKCGRLLCPAAVLAARVLLFLIGL